MRAINKPQYSPHDVFIACVNSISNTDLRTRMNSIESEILSSARDYEAKVVDLELFTIVANSQRNNEIIVGAVTKLELKNLYGHHMLGLTKPARKIYDELINSAPKGKCPFCGFGQATTLDHYLPKSKFPLLSIIPSNLVPCCKDCNTGKSSALATTKGSQLLHPYYDHGGYINCQWLFAEVCQTRPVTVQYYVNPDRFWGRTFGERVNAHFLSFNLRDRFSIEASNELASLKGLLEDYSGSLNANGIKNQLRRTFLSEYQIHANSWKTALYQALMQSSWYCGGGYKEWG